MYPIPASILWVLDTLHNHHKEAFLVGGCVRDMLMRRDIHDFDITTSALPQETIEIFSRQHCKVIPTGLQHGTITVLVDHEPIEITTYRVEQEYLNHRKPTNVDFTTNLKEDLLRRDFTMNAIAYEPNTGFVDPYQGQLDITNQIIRCVGNANERLQEDALRILRALRFALTLQFNIDEACVEAIQLQASTLSHISAERITSEFTKIVMANQPDTLSFLRKHHVLDIILPGYERTYDFAQPTPWHLYDVFTHTDIALNHAIGYPLESRLAIIFHDIGKVDKQTFDEHGIAHYKQHALASEDMARKYMRQSLRYDHRTIERVCTLIRFHDYYVTPRRSVLRKFLANLHQDLDLAFQVLDVQLADDYAKNMEKAQEKIDNIMQCKQLLLQMKEEQDLPGLRDLKINGHDLLALGYQGKAIGEVLQYLFEQVLLDPSINTKEKLLALVKKP